MRDNISIIFAAIFAVLLLIVFPLFSLLNRQDNIAYNKVLTLTTEFVDSVRTKGYFTDKEYTNYIAGLSATQNTYKVDMECHQKMLIKDVNNYTSDNPVWVEDTAVYYNSYIQNALEKENVVAFEEGDEFYIKLYNTNITTATLMYNFFLNTKVPSKVINLGYGGKVLNSTGKIYTRTVFNSSYTPYVTFEEVTNKNGIEFKMCDDTPLAGIYIQYCTRRIDIEDENNNPIKVNFTLHNFQKIGDKYIDLNTFEENKDYFVKKIKESTLLRGDYVANSDIEITDLKYNAGNITGTVVVKNITMNSGAWKTNAYIIISSNLGIGTTGVSSSEGITEELTLVRRDITSNLEIKRAIFE